MPETPEQKARLEIDDDLVAAGWLVQSRDELDLAAGRGIVVREFVMKQGVGFADYLLYVDRKAIGAVEAKVEGTLTGVEAQSGKYAAGLPDNLPAHRRPLPFLFESNGAVTYFTNGLDPAPRGRQVLIFPVQRRWQRGLRRTSNFAPACRSFPNRPRRACGVCRPAPSPIWSSPSPRPTLTP